MRTRPDLEPVSRPDPDLLLPPDEPRVRHDGTGTLVAVVTLFVVLTLVTLLAV